MKVSWPLSAREALVHYFQFEYFQDGLIVVLLNSVSDLDAIDKCTHGFTRDGIPDAQDVVRIDVVGGFAIQKVTKNRSYFRTIANMDIKLDIVPPAFINFISRQLIGSGFKLYKKEVASVSKGDKDFSNALEDPLYARIREALYSGKLATEPLEMEDMENDASPFNEEHSRGKNESTSLQQKMKAKTVVTDLPGQCTIVRNENTLCEIQEILEENEVSDKDNESQEISEENEVLDKDSDKLCIPPSDEIVETSNAYSKKKVVIRPEVEQALGTLEKVISIFRDYGCNQQPRHLPGNIRNENSENIQKDGEKQSTSLGIDQSREEDGTCCQLLRKESIRINASEPRNSSASHGSRCLGSNSYAREANHNKIAPVSPGDDFANSVETNHIALFSSENQTTEGTILDKANKQDDLVNSDANSIIENRTSKRKSKKLRYCCLYFVSGQLAG